jgi:DNA-binding HxlR family transcriptional regulator
MTPAPKPGKPVRGSTTGRPVMALLDLLGRRWALRVMWELRERPLPFRELRDRCDSMSPSVLNTRLRELREAGIVDAAPAGYVLTDEGMKLARVLLMLDDWARHWANRVA